MINSILYFLFFNSEFLINEIRVSPGDTVEWIELRNLSQNDIYGVKIISMEDTATINIHSNDSIILIGKNEIIGNLIFDDIEDSIKIFDPYGVLICSFYYSNNASFSENTSKTPPPFYSSSLFFGPADPFNPVDTVFHFYIDSTPTPGFINDDYGWISGYVCSIQNNLPIADAQIHAQGINGFGENTVYTDTNGYYIVYGLGIDIYALCASKDGYYPQCYPELVQVYPESTITGINFYLNPIKIEEFRKLNKDKHMIIFLKEKQILKIYNIFDITGRKIKLLSKGIYILKKDKKAGKIIFIK